MDIVHIFSCLASLRLVDLNAIIPAISSRVSSLASLRLVDLNKTKKVFTTRLVCLASLRLVDLNLWRLFTGQGSVGSSLLEASGSKYGCDNLFTMKQLGLASLRLVDLN